MNRKQDVDDQVSADRIYWTAIEYAVDCFIKRLAKTKNKAVISAGRKRRDPLISTPLGRDTSQVKRRSTNGKRKDKLLSQIKAPPSS